ncbi:2610_t:CDS:2, partial [Acaulospora colombiana]
MSKQRATRTVASRSAAPIGISGKTQETQKGIIFFAYSHVQKLMNSGGFPTGLDVDNLRLPPSTRSKPTSLKEGPKKETVVRLLKQEEDEQQLNLCVGDRVRQLVSIELIVDTILKFQVQFTGKISDVLVYTFNPFLTLVLFLIKLMYARWFTEQLSNDGFEDYHKNGKEKLDAMNQRALTRPNTRSMTRVTNALSISGHPSLKEILDTFIQQARDPHRPSPERLPSSNREIVNQRILSTCQLLEGDPDSAMKLYGNICAAGSKDPTKEWLLCFGIPCSVVHKKSTPRNSDHSLFENAEELSEDDGEQRRRSSSSSMTLIHMKKCGWDFYDKLPEVDSKRTPTATANKKAQRPLQDVTVRSREPRGPRESGRDGRSLGIHFNLIIEIRTQLKQLSLSTLNLPERWKFIGQMNERLPQLVLPDEYKRALGKADRRVSGSKIHEISKSQVTSPVSSIKKPLSVQRDHLSQSSPSEEPVQQSDLEKYLYQSLRERFPLTGQRLRDDFQAKEVEKVIEDWNAMPRHLNLTIDLYRALAQLGALEKVVWLSDREMVQQDSMCRSGNPTINERIYGGTILEQDIVRNFLVYRSPRNALSEGEVESGCGAILQKIMAGNG